MSVRDIFRTDIVLLHAPSVYDFRVQPVMHGPIADAVPSTNEFEMYPVGLTSIAAYLSANHLWGKFWRNSADSTRTGITGIVPFGPPEAGINGPWPAGLQQLMGCGPGYQGPG